MRRRLIPHRLRSRLLLTYVALTLLGLGGFIIWTGVRLQAAIVERAQHELQVQALLVANALYEPLDEWREGKERQRSSLASLVRSYAQRAGVRVTVLDARFQVLVSSDESVPPPGEHPYPELMAAQSGRVQSDIRRNRERHELRMFVATPVLGEKGEMAGIAQLSMSMTPLWHEVRQTWISLLSAGGMVLVMTTLASLILAHQVTGPIRSLTMVSEAIAAGRLDQQVTPSGPDEVARLGQTFNRMAGRVRELLARQQAFVANAAHELRSPLASLRLRLDMLHAHGADDPELRQRYLCHMAQEVGALQRLVDHLLALSSLDEGAMPSRTCLDLAPVLYDVADEMAPLAQAGGVQLHVDVPAHLPPVAASSHAMVMLVRNLLDNAIKYTPAGGHVTLSAAPAGRPPGTPRMAAVRDGPPSGAVIRVADTGPGIPAEDLPHIFERFYRVDKSRSHRQGGAGLGLALVRAIVEAHSGWVGMDSTLGKGSTFTVYLPLSPAAQPFRPAG